MFETLLRHRPRSISREWLFFMRGRSAHSLRRECCLRVKAGAGATATKLALAFRPPPAAGAALSGTRPTHGSSGPLQLPNPVVFDEQTAEVSTQSDTYVDLGGPTVTVNVPSSGLIAVFARADVRGADGSNLVGPFEGNTPLTTNGPFAILENSIATSYQRLWTSTAPSGIEAGTADTNTAGWIVFEATPGSHTYTLKYRSAPQAAPGATAFFRNRKLWVVGVG
jgi:hypothetical protein